MTKQDVLDSNKLRQALEHVIWIAGGPDAGKTSVATQLAHKYGLQFYSCDEHAENHWENYVSQDPDSFGHRLMQLSVEERWLQSPQTQFHSVLRIIEDDFPLVVDDLLRMPKEPLIVVEGNLPPKLMAPLLTAKQQGIWLVPNEAFYQASFYRREKHLGHRDYKDPVQTEANHIARDGLFIEYIKQETIRGGFELLEIDGSRSLSDVMNKVESHFVSFLKPIFSRD